MGTSQQLFCMMAPFEGEKVQLPFLRKKDSVPCSHRTPNSPWQCANGGDQIAKRQMNEVIEFLLCPMNQDKKHKMMNEAPQEGDCHGNTRAQGKPGSSTPLVTDRTRCTHTLESATNIYIFFHSSITIGRKSARAGVHTYNKALSSRTR